MSSMTTTSRLNRVRTAGTREWWLAYLLGPLVLLGVGLALFPRVVYDQFIWQYLWGPVVADAANQPVTHNGVTAVKGYNPINTLTYLVVVLYVLPGLREFLTAFEIDLSTRLAYGLAPIIIAGGAMRALEDAGVLTRPLELFFITPSIYFVTAGITLLALLVGVGAREQYDISPAVVVASVGVLWTVLAFGLVVQYGITSGRPVRFIVPVLTVGIALLVTGGYYAAGTLGGWTALTRPMYLLVIFGQAWDGAQNLVGGTLYGYTPKMFITRTIYEWTNFAGSTFVLKVIAVGFVVWVLADGEEEMDYTWWWLIAVIITAVGLPMGVRGSIRIMLGV